jgi:hypothetical protein
MCREALQTGIPLSKGQTGRLTLVEWPNITFVQVIKSKQVGVWNIKRIIVQGQQTMIKQIIRTTQGKGMINTAYIERLNATFRQRLVCLSQRKRFLARQQTSMYLLECVNNFCDFHKSFRLRLSVGRNGSCWVKRTPVLAAQLTDHCWSLEELFTTKHRRHPGPKNRGAAGFLPFASSQGNKLGQIQRETSQSADCQCRHVGQENRNFGRIAQCNETVIGVIASSTPDPLLPFYLCGTITCAGQTCLRVCSYSRAFAR